MCAWNSAGCGELIGEFMRDEAAEEQRSPHLYWKEVASTPDLSGFTLARSCQRILRPVSRSSPPPLSRRQSYSPRQTHLRVSPYHQPHLSQPPQQEIKKPYPVRIFMIGHSTRPAQPKYRPPHSRFFSQRLFNTCRSASVELTTSNAGKF